MWAERRTDVVAVGETSAAVQAVSLWVHLDNRRWVPTPLTEAELTIYGGVPPDRRVSHRLRHPAPESAEGGSPWTFRATECDIADHVNNAAYWAPLEEELLAGPDPVGIDAELEYRTPSQPGHKRFERQGRRRWLVGEDGELHATIVIAGSADGHGG
jgi:acyl-ACP thioesterase